MARVQAHVGGRGTEGKGFRSRLAGCPGAGDLTFPGLGLWSSLECGTPQGRCFGPVLASRVAVCRRDEVRTVASELRPDHPNGEHWPHCKMARTVNLYVKIGKCPMPSVCVCLCGVKGGGSESGGPCTAGSRFQHRPFS